MPAVVSRGVHVRRGIEIRATHGFLHRGVVGRFDLHQNGNRVNASDREASFPVH
jgi:hypothetical protein